MEPTSFTKTVTTESRGSSSTDDLSNMAGSEMLSRIASSPNPSVDCVSISQPSTPLITCDTSPTKRVLSLDLEMRPRKRRRGYTENDYIIYYSSPTTTLRLPNLIPLEDCSDSHETCLPDTSFLLQKKPLKRRRPTII